MVRIYLLLCFIFFSIFSTSFGAQEPDCVRPPTDDIYEYKETYVPVEFDHEPFGMEVADLAVLVIVMLVGTWFSLKKRPAKWLSLLMVAGFLYFGLIRGGCICPVGATTNFCIGLSAPELIGRIIAILFLLPLVFTFFVGRVFCSSACPIGAVQHLFSRRKGSYQLSKHLNFILRLLPIALLFVTIWAALRGGMFIACKLDVYKLIFFTGHAWLDQAFLALNGALIEPRVLLIGDLVSWIILASALLLGYVVPRPFCRFLCPYSVLLGIISKLGLRHRRIDTSSCVGCVQCEKTCPVQAISSDSKNKEVALSQFHCIQCGRCDEVCKFEAIKN